jgi:hypothetical protein
MASNSVAQELAEHVLVEMRDDHAGMYRELLAGLGLSDQEIGAMAESDATRRYKHSFLQRFGIGEENFEEAVIALSGRELFASVRNRFISESLRKYGIGPCRWLEVHETLELEHFRDAIRPFLTRCDNTPATIDRMLTLIKDEIDRHIRYWDALLVEAKRLAV